MMNFYMNSGVSVDTFMEVFYECFLIDDEDEDEYKSYLCNEDQIKKIINCELKPFNKNID